MTTTDDLLYCSDDLILSGSDRADCEISLVGLKAGSCYITALYGTSRYFQIYRGELTTGASVLVKAPASVSSELFSATSTDAYAANAFVCELGSRMAIEVTPESVFIAQLDRLRGIAHKSVVSVLESSRASGSQWFSMHYVEGNTMRESFAGGCSLNCFYDLACVLQDLENLSWRHLDLKPENILLTGDGVVLVDPGFCGKLSLPNGNEIDAVVTTLAYNPLFEPDDKLAFGLMLWEYYLGGHLSSRLAPGRESIAGISLRGWIDCLETTGNFSLFYFADLRRPTELIPNCSDELESLLLMSIGLELKNGLLELREVAAPWSAIIEKIELVRASI